jgi:hypothetical protein
MDITVLTLTGTPRQMGLAFGEMCRSEIAELYALRIQAALNRAKENGKTLSEGDILCAARPCLPITKAYDLNGFEEFTGIAEGAGISPEKLYALQGLTDLRDIISFAPPPDGAGCSSFMAGAKTSLDGKILAGQTWDLLTDNLPFVRLIGRKADKGPETWSLSVVGGLSMIGINSDGIAVGMTNLTTSDAQSGVQYLSIVHKALGESNFEKAVSAITKARRAGGHYYFIANAEKGTGLECSATKFVRIDLKENEIYTHCNHALYDEIKAMEAKEHKLGTSTLFRQNRLQELLEKETGNIRPEMIKEAFSDHEGGSDCICRHNIDNVNTNACVILSPAKKEIQVCPGQAHSGNWITKSF